MVVEKKARSSVERCVAFVEMADFYGLWKNKDSIVDELRALLDEAAAAAPIERDSCIRIQRLFRGASVRSKLIKKRQACIDITRVFRGHRGRVVFKEKESNLRELQAFAHFNYYARIIQCTFRGFYSRSPE